MWQDEKLISLMLPQVFPVPDDNRLIKNLPVVSILDNHLL